MTIHITFDLIGRVVVWGICLFPAVWFIGITLFARAISGLWPWDHWEWVNQIQRKRYERKHGKPRNW